MRTELAALVVAGALVITSGSREAHAQTKPVVASESDLAAARALFQDAYRDEQQGRFSDALDKFRRVAVVRESASVRYRIGSVLAALGRLRESRDAFRALAASRAQLNGADLDIADSAAERAQTLDHRIPRLVLKLDAPPPADARVTIDGAPVPVAVVARRFEVDPGEHLVQASAPSALSSESKVTLTEGAEAQVTVLLPLRNGSVAPRAADGAPSSPPAIPSKSSHRTLPIVAVSVGGALVVAGVVFLAIRQSEISDINDACAPTCPSADHASLESKHDDALVFGPLGWALGGAGLALAGVGMFFLLTGPSDPKAPSAAAVRVGTLPLPGGGLLSASTSW